jgi:hypothetical protein
MGLSGLVAGEPVQGYAIWRYFTFGNHRLQREQEQTAVSLDYDPHATVGRLQYDLSHRDLCQWVKMKFWLLNKDNLAWSSSQ